MCIRNEISQIVTRIETYRRTSRCIKGVGSMPDLPFGAQRKHLSQVLHSAVSRSGETVVRGCTVLGVPISSSAMRSRPPQSTVARSRIAAAGQAEAGKKIFRPGSACHQPGATVKARVVPPLDGTIGRNRGTPEGFPALWGARRRRGRLDRGEPRRSSPAERQEELSRAQQESGYCRRHFKSRKRRC